MAGNAPLQRINSANVMEHLITDEFKFQVKCAVDNHERFADSDKDIHGPFYHGLILTYDIESNKLKTYPIRSTITEYEEAFESHLTLLEERNIWSKERFITVLYSKDIFDISIEGRYVRGLRMHGYFLELYVNIITGKFDQGGLV